jgi:hypothetical protein
MSRGRGARGGGHGLSPIEGFMTPSRNAGATAASQRQQQQAASCAGGDEDETKCAGL